FTATSLSQSTFWYREPATNKRDARTIVAAHARLSRIRTMVHVRRDRPAARNVMQAPARWTSFICDGRASTRRPQPADHTFSHMTTYSASVPVAGLVARDARVSVFPLT